MSTIQNRVLNRLRATVGNFRHRYVDEFVFIHINKTGGSSIERALGIPFEHRTAMEVIGDLGEELWNKKLTFTVVRNPWDKVVSHYHHRVKKNRTSLQTDTVEFKEWVALTYGRQDPFYFDNPKMFLPQTDWISDENGNILVDQICRFERLEDDFNRICRMLDREAPLPHLKSTKRGDYRDYYDDETADIVSRWFARDLKRFDYHF